MAKLKCYEHGRRVMVLPSGSIVHRTGDGSVCRGKYGFVEIRGQVLTATEVVRLKTSLSRLYGKGSKPKNPITQINEVTMQFSSVMQAFAVSVEDAAQVFSGLYVNGRMEAE